VRTVDRRPKTEDRAGKLHKHVWEPLTEEVSQSDESRLCI